MYDHTFTAQQILELVPMGYPSLSDLVRRGVIVPSKRRGVGRGTPSLYDVFDLVGIATVAFVRPRASSTTLMSALYAFWHSPEGRRLVENATESKAVRGVVVLDVEGRVSYEVGLTIDDLFAKKGASMLHVIEPRALMNGLFHDFALKRMTEPLPSGHLPRSKKKPPSDVRHAGRSERTKKTAKKMPMPETPGRATAKKNAKNKMRTK